MDLYCSDHQQLEQLDGVSLYEGCVLKADISFLNYVVTCEL